VRIQHGNPLHLLLHFNMAAPLTTISYRLQNVDFLSYIELPDDTAKTEMRPFKDSTRQQVGRFDKVKVDVKVSHRL
jgi:hypothetical protein